ncbi:MAG: hypothetical protein ACREJU_02715, partial [Nitrospiraceae bacterium]
MTLEKWKKIEALSLRSLMNPNPRSAWNLIISPKEIDGTFDGAASKVILSDGGGVDRISVSLAIARL